MAGSIKEMIYTTDGGDLWLVKVDESNGESYGFLDFTGVEVFDQTGVPPGCQMRYLNWRADDGTLTRRFWVGVPDQTNFKLGGALEVPILVGNTVVPKPGRFTSAVGEIRRLPSISTAGADTGLNDGDAT